MCILGERKRAIAKVTVKRGTGKVTINDIPFTKYFSRMEDRYEIIRTNSVRFLCKATSSVKIRQGVFWGVWGWVGVFLYY